MPMQTPSATYRLQLQPTFTFSDAARLVPYLAGLGISHVYCSPIVQPTAGSLHGYDVTDPTHLSRALGGAAGWRELQAALRTAGLGLIVDVVPNHMAVKENPWFTDLLRHGSKSAFFHYFDLGPDASDVGMPRRIVLPVLGQPYGMELDAGRLALAVDGGRLMLTYGSESFPIAITSIGDLLQEAADASTSPSLHQLARRVALTRGSRRGMLALDAHLARVLRNDSDGPRAIRDVVAVLNSDPERLHRLLERQYYRLAWWRLARDEQAYRRFFDINGLIGVRVELPDVFERTHALLLRLVRSGQVAGLRIDHVDGLADPRGYLERLVGEAPNVWVVVEKILALDEPMPDWPVAGTTGYELGAWTTMLLNAPESEDPLTEFYERFSGLSDAVETVVEDAVREVSAHWIAADVGGVAATLHRLCQADPHLRDYSARDCVALVREMLAALPVYRTYASRARLSARDADLVAGMIDRVRERRPDLPDTLIRFAAGLFGESPSAGGDAFVTRFQQLSPAIRAKAIEDTAGFRYNRLIALNDVGGEPGRFSVTVGEFHSAVTAWQRDRCRGLRATSTHDTKRSEDVRARLTVLTEDWEGWTRAVDRWSDRLAALRIDGFPDRNFEYYFYQTLVGAWPLTRDRAWSHAEKAIREAKTFTNWLLPAATYEDAVRRFVDGCFADRGFLDEVGRYVETLHPADWHKALSQLVLKLTVPGVPDLYQGSELWLHTLSDPDNRQPVDFDHRRRLLAALPGLSADDILRRSSEGLPKLWTIVRTLALRNRRVDAFACASPYRPLTVTGPHANHVIAFTRGDDVAVAAPTRASGVDWTGTRLTLPDDEWSSVLTGDRWSGGEIPMAELFTAFPVALLERSTA